MRSLELNKMVNLQGGQTNPLEDQDACNDLVNGLSGSLVIFGFASVWTGIGGVATFVGSVGVYALQQYCNEL